MEFESYIVYAKSNDAGYITAINSSEFLVDLTDWMKIDEGVGDKYHHAQGNYFTQPIMTDDGAYRYKLVNGIVEECSAEEIAEQEAAHEPVPETATTDDVLNALLGVTE